MSHTVSRPFDPWNERAITGTEQPQVMELARLLELRGRGDEERAVRDTYLNIVGVHAGNSVLDAGCGSGVVTRELARRVGLAGRVVGLDPSSVMLAFAQEIAAQEGVHHQIEFCVGDVRALPFEDASFDVVVAVTTLAHTTNAESALPGLLRVLRPGGRIGIFDLDTTSWVISHPDRELTLRIGAFGATIATDGWLARRLPGLLVSTGFADVQVRAFTPLDRDPGGFYARNAELWAEAALHSGVVSEDERQAWVSALHAEQAGGYFFAGLTRLFVWASRPAR
jgi:ubiquinone/menaquinone biosynthesis C-methylase UbiE